VSILLASTFAATAVVLLLASWPARAAAVQRTHALAGSSPSLASAWRIGLSRKLRAGRRGERSDALVLGVDNAVRAAVGRLARPSQRAATTRSCGR
jgi:hypothetical protein